jgi:hypothetical protein
MQPIFLKIRLYLKLNTKTESSITKFINYEKTINPFIRAIF